MSRNMPESHKDHRDRQSSFGIEELFSNINLEPYVGRWVAIASGQVAGVGETALSAENMGRRNRIRERLAVYFVEPREGAPFPTSRIFEKVRPVLVNMDVPIYLVGGAVRDALLGQTSHDLDFVMPRNAIQVTFRVADELGFPAYVLDRERDAGRIVLDDPAITLDFTSYRGIDLEADLRARDFTINAMALPVAALNQASLIDPCDARSDLTDQTIRICYAKAIEDDPIRGLRAIRLQIETGFIPTQETTTAICAAAPNLNEVSKERVRDEVIKLMATERPGTAFTVLAEWQLLRYIFPELVQQPDDLEPEYGLDQIVARTKAVLDYLAAFELIILGQSPKLPDLPANFASRVATVQEKFTPYILGLEAHFNRRLSGGVDGWSTVRLAAMLNQLTRHETKGFVKITDARVSQEQGNAAKIIGEVLRKYRLSRQVIQQIKQSLNGYEEWSEVLATHNVDRRAAHRFFRTSPDTGLDVCLLVLAERLEINNEDSWNSVLEAIKKLFEFYFDYYEAVIRPTPILDGYELITLLDLEPGPEIGRLLQLIEEAQAAGEVKTRDQVLELARQNITKAAHSF